MDFLWPKKTDKRRKGLKHDAYNGRVPWQRFEEFVEAPSGSKVIDNPVIAVAVDDRLVEVKHDENSSHQIEITLQE